MIEKTMTVKCPSGEEEKLLNVVVLMTKDSAVALMMSEAHAEEETMTVDPDGALMMTVVGSGGALMMTVGPGGALTMTADQGVEWTTTVAQEEALTKTVDPVEAWMKSEGLDVGQMMTGAPEEEGMMRGEAAGVWMTLAHVVEMTLQHGNLLGDKVQAHVVFLFLLACCQICVLKGSYHEKYICPVTKQCDAIICYWSME